MANVSYHIANLLEKMTSADKDFRFMATNDLMSELQKDAIKLDEDSERKVVKMLLKLLEDKNGEVQNLAVKCMGPLVNKVKEHHVSSAKKFLQKFLPRYKMLKFKTFGNFRSKLSSILCVRT